MRIPQLIITLIILSLLLGMYACSEDEDGPSVPVVTQTPTTETQVPVVITIGNLTDLTGVSAGAMTTINKALKDVVAYYNDEGLIPGVELKIIDFDGQFDPSRDVVGYRSLKERGADFIWTPVPATVTSLKDVVNQEGFMLFTPTGNVNDLIPPGYVFSLGIIPQLQAYTLLKWIAENDPDFPTDRPAKIGGAAWIDANSDAFLRAVEEYTQAHPEQYEYVGGYLTGVTFNWATQVENLKDCDYVYVPAPPQAFVQQYRQAGYEAKFIGTDLHSAFLGVIDSSNLWDEIDGMLFIRASRWYNESGPIIDLVNEILEKYRPEEAESIRRSGSGYLAVKQVYFMLDIVKNAVEKVGPENFDSQALYDAAISWSYSYKDIDVFNSFNATKRYSQNYYVVYEARAGETSADSDIYRVHEEWLPQIAEP